MAKSSLTRLKAAVKKALDMREKQKKMAAGKKEAKRKAQSVGKAMTIFEAATALGASMQSRRVDEPGNIDMEVPFVIG
eukprot:5902551-Amphidinium_carterae.1